MFKLLKWSIKTVLVLTGILPLVRCTSGYKEKNGKVTFNGKEIADKSFVVLSNEFAKDSTTAYYKNHSFQYADVATFEAVDAHYAKDKNKVYYCDEYREGQNYYLTKKQTIRELKNVHPVSFVSIGDGYGKDNFHAWFQGIAFSVKDIASLKSVNSSFAKDDFHAYLNRLPVEGSDGKTFELINGEYAKDKSNIYFYGYTGNENKSTVTINCDRKTFTILEYPFSKDTTRVFYEGKRMKDAHASSFVLIGNGYSKDKDAVFYKATKMEGANAAAFEQFKENDLNLHEHGYAKDDKLVYLDNTKINGAEVSSFRVLTLAYGADNKHVFYKASVVKDADPATFKTYEHGYGDADAEDAKNKYLEGKKVIAE